VSELITRPNCELLSSPQQSPCPFQMGSGWRKIWAQCVFASAKKTIVIQWLSVLAGQFKNKYLRLGGF
jgi:hypothetical protein